MRGLGRVGQVAHVLPSGFDGGVGVIDKGRHTRDRVRDSLGERVATGRQNIGRGDQGGAQQRGVLTDGQSAHRCAVLRELNGIVVRVPGHGIDLARGEGGLLGVTDLLDRDLVLAEPGRGQRHEEGVPGLPRLAGGADAAALQIGQVGDIGILGHDDAAGVALVETADDAQASSVGGGDDRLVRAGHDDLLGAGQKGVELPFLLAVVAKRDPRSVPPVLQRQVEGGELDVGRVGQADDQIPGGAGGGGCFPGGGTRAAGAEKARQSRDGGGGQD